MILSTVNLCRISTLAWRIDRFGFYIIAVVALEMEFHCAHRAR